MNLTYDKISDFLFLKAAASAVSNNPILTARQTEPQEENPFELFDVSIDSLIGLFFGNSKIKNDWKHDWKSEGF